MTGPLEGYTVLDLSRGVAGPMATMFFADYGANVIRIEPPGGDLFRSLLPGYHVWNRGKRGLTLDLKTTAGSKILTRLLRGADVLIAGFGAGVSERLGFDYDTVSARFPGIVYCSISGYGDPAFDREHAGFEALVQARSGLCNEQPGFRPGPNFGYFPTASYGAAILAATGAIAALYQRASSGQGQHVRTSLMDGVRAALALQLAWARTPTRNLATPSSSSAPGYGAPTVDAYICADGRYLYIHTGAKGSFERLCQLIGCKAEDFPGYYPAHFVSDPEQGHQFRMLLINAFLAKPMAEMAAELQRHEIAVGPCLAPGEIMRHQQAVANQLAIELDDPELGPIIQVGLPVKFQVTPGAVRGPARLAGADNAEILSAAAVDTEPAAEARKAASIGARSAIGSVLAGVKVLDLGNFIAGPAACLPLADLGAEVIKLEPLGGDPIRGLERVFVGAQRGRRSIAVDIKRTEGLEIARKLAARADVIEHNFRPGVADRLGLGYADICKVNPAVIYCHVTAFGSRGPLAQAPGFETITRAWSGIDTSSGGEGNPPLKLAGSPIDMFSGLLAAMGIMMALDYRRRTGRGQFLEMPQLTVGMLFQSQAFLTRQGLVPQFKMDPRRTGFGAFYRLYETRSGWVCVCCPDQPTARKMLKVMNLDGLAVSPAPGQDQKLAQAFEQRFLDRDAAEWTEMLRNAGIPIELVRAEPADDILQDPQAVRDGLIAEFPHPIYGILRVVGNLIGLSAASAAPNQLPPPLVGQHTAAILAELGYSSSAMAALENAGVVAKAPG